jgi:hypothetical protein
MSNLAENPVLDGLPGEELVRQGLIDLGAGTESICALLVAIGYPRLHRMGVVSMPADRLPDDPEIQLYRLLQQQAPREAYPQYNSLIRRLVSFERALEHRQRSRRKNPVAGV